MRTNLFLMAALAATVAMTSCNKNDEVPANNDGKIVLSSANLASRSAAQNLQLTQFENNEKIGVFINENAASPTDRKSTRLNSSH